MKKYILCLGLCLGFLFPFSAKAATLCPSPVQYKSGECCPTVGETHLDENSTAIIACLYTDATKTDQKWQSMTSTAMTAPSIKTTSATGGFDGRNFSYTCPSGSFITSCISMSQTGNFVCIPTVANASCYINATNHPAGCLPLSEPWLYLATCAKIE